MPPRPKLTPEQWTEKRRLSAERQRERTKIWKQNNPRPPSSLPVARIEAQLRRIDPSPAMLQPLHPRPHPLAALVYAQLPQTHPAYPKVQRGAILVWQLSTYARDVHTSYQHWVHIESAQWLASPIVFPALMLARRFLALRRLAKCPDTPESERGSLGTVHWSPESLAAITHDQLTPFGDYIHASPV